MIPMFANVIENGKPICPMANCHKPVENDGEIWTADPLAMLKAFANGFLAEAEGLVIIHKSHTMKE